jgi:hypothetical protein
MSFGDNADSEGWSGGISADVAGFGSVLQLDQAARHASIPGGETVTTLFDLPTGSSAAVLGFDMTFADSWDGEAGVIYVNGIEVGRGVYNWRDVSTWQDGQGDPPNLTLTGAPGILIEMTQATSSLQSGVGRYNEVGTDYSYRMRIEVDDPDLPLFSGPLVNRVCSPFVCHHSAA